jgi:hypothetical protein
MYRDGGSIGMAYSKRIWDAMRVGKQQSFVCEVYLTPSIIGGCLLHSLTYKTGYSAPSNYLKPSK